MIDDDEDDYEGYFLRPANEYNIKEKIIQANQESFAIPTPPSPRHPANGERRVTFREQLVDYEPDEYSSEDDGGYGGGGGGTGDQRDGRTGSRRRNQAVIETVADVHRDADGSLRDADAPDTIIEELHLDERERPVDGDDEGEEEVVEEEQLDYDEDDDNGVGAGDRIEKHKTGVEAESLVVSEEEEEEESAGVVEEVEEQGEEEEEPTDGSSMDTEIHNPESSEEISSSPLKTYRSEADSRSGSGDSQAEDGQTGSGAPTGGDGAQDQYKDDAEHDEEAEQEGSTSRADGEGSDDDGRPLESHRTRRSANCRRKCCRHKKSSGEKLPYYNGFRSEYGLSREELEEKKRRLEARRQRVRERQQRRTAEQRQKAQSNEEAFATWLHGKLRNSINKHQNMYDVRQQSVGAGNKHQQQQQQQLLHPHRRRRNAVHQVHHTMHQISYG
ncbi:cilia- and flagella-associated protein 251 [Anopheles bellator]|uniref:cilia- and flagella-associated protein 251 n=1 Tax=Anopheles bellator TaxID=139047 RepID=UPI0026479BA1|nr:cilia- and flagella-associated protein 251 [Anopheles bellator]